MSWTPVSHLNQTYKVYDDEVVILSPTFTNAVHVQQKLIFRNTRNFNQVVIFHRMNQPANYYIRVAFFTSRKNPFGGYESNSKATLALYEFTSVLLYPLRQQELLRCIYLIPDPCLRYLLQSQDKFSHASKGILFVHVFFVKSIFLFARKYRILKTKCYKLQTRQLD